MLVLTACLAGGFHYSNAGEYTFTTVDYPGAEETLIRGINNEGTIVGQYGTFNFNYIELPGNHGFVLEDGDYTTIDYPGAVSTSVEGINESGQMVGTYYTASQQVRGYLLDGDTFQEIMVPDSYDTFATGINGSGDIVGYYTTNALRDTAIGFLYDGQSYQDIIVPGFPKTFPTDINDAGKIVGTAASDYTVGFYYDEGAVTTIVHPGSVIAGYSFTGAYGINNDGLVAGTYQTSQIFTMTTWGFTWSEDSGFVEDAIDIPGSGCSIGTGGCRSRGTVRHQQRRHHCRLLRQLRRSLPRLCE